MVKIPRMLLALVTAGCIVGLAACGDGSDDETGTGDGETANIAFLSPSASNTYLSETWEAVEEVAKEHGAKVTQFDAQFDVARQQEQLQNIVASGQYDGIVISPVTEAVSADVMAAAEAGLMVVVEGNILGTDLDTPDPQVDGVGLSVVTPHARFGDALGALTKEACADKDPCRVVYFWGIKGGPQDTARHDGFTSSIADEPSIEIVAELDDQYATDTALAEVQNLLQTDSDFDVVIGTDQSVTGAQLALEQVDQVGDVALIGLGGSEVAVAEVKAGNWFGGVMTAPRTEGMIAANGLFELLEDGELSTPAGVDPLEEFPNGGMFTQENVDEIDPEWKG